MDTTRSISTCKLRRVLAVAASAACIMAGVPSYGTSLPISLVGANCTGSVDTSTGAISLSCTPPVAQAPTCTLSVLPTSVPATGGSVTLTSNCGTVNAWTKNSASTSQTSAAWTDSIPATSLTTTATFTYTVSGTGGTASAQVVQYGVPATPTPTTPTTTISCDSSGYTATHVIPVTLGSSTTRFYTNKNGGFANSDIDVYVISVPSTLAANTYFRLAGAEYGDQPTMRTASISQTPCDFSATLGTGAFFDSSPTVTMYAQIVASGQSGGGYYPALQQGGTYYLNVKNWSYGSWQCTSTSCNMYMDFLKN